ncbi:MAG: radical SAM protein [Candidatus Thiodiazotropha sp. (ex Myrtea sp. 'scaly one' KF741663)]|nr:radical SAM protein [Candidatus Thiodiazotropha sp. (ex Myrtea sp. 'scaly one' KF741663)]
MPESNLYEDKLPGLLQQAGSERLSDEQQKFLSGQAQLFRFTQQELKQLCDMAVDLAMWNAGTMEQVWPPVPKEGLGPKQRRQRLLQAVRTHWQALREQPTRYPEIPVSSSYSAERIQRVNVEKDHLGLGWCPVASTRTRCCNLMTLDAVENCGFDCSYCSIQSFYHGDEVRFDSRFAEKLARLEIDPDRFYHIGTGQSSDSLMWGNQAGILDALLSFAAQHPNVILELKTKSKNINHLLKHEVPPNVLCTWSLNTPTLIANEEHLTASLDERLRAARRLADKGVVVGFHFHPMIHYDHWREDYGELFQRLTGEFDAHEVALVSLGTLTYIKPVIKQLRARPDFQSRVLQMPMVEADGKLSYPDEIKQEMFSFAYRSLEAWHNQVFFYLCMENQRFWQPVFGFDYPSNEAFETAMKESYLAKISTRRRD